MIRSGAEGSGRRPGGAPGAGAAGRGGRGNRRPGGRAVLISVGVHLAVLVPFVALARAPEPVEMQAIRVNLVAAPPASVAEAEPVAAASPPPQPEPQPAREEPTPEPQREEPRPEPPRQRPPEERVERPPTETPPTPEPEPERQPPQRDRADAETGTTGGDALNVNTEGRDFPYPDYIANILNQVYRYFRWSDDSRPKGVVYFEILSDGSVRGIRMQRSSGNIRFDFAVQGAVETAANRGAFGPLPEGFAAPFLPVTIEVEPPR